MARITINGITIDPQPQYAKSAFSSLSATSEHSTEFVLIQVDQPLNATKRTALENHNVELLEYVPESTYIARAGEQDLAAIRALPFVTWANPYLRGFKVSSDLLGAPSSKGPELMALAEVDDAGGQGRGEVDIVFHAGVDPSAHVAEVSSAAGLPHQALVLGGNKIRAVIDRSRLRDVAAVDVVRHIEPVFVPELSDDVAVAILGADVVHCGGLSLRGAGQVVAVCDTGFDKGSKKNVHRAFTGRVKQLYARGRPGASNDPHGHGTHVAGSVLGDGTASNHGPVAGTAPAAELVLQSVLDAGGGLGGLPADLNALFRETYTGDGARVHTNSWGTTNSRGRYTSYSAEVDEFVWKHRDQVVCFAAGNPGRDSKGIGVIDSGSVEAPGTAKNCITVGASENNRPGKSRPWGTGSWSLRYPAEPIASDPWADDPEGMAAFSGRGPTKDGRIKPDVVAPGTSIFSAHSRDASVGQFWGTSPDPAYCYMGGTSMATPLVAGCAAVVREALAKHHDNETPSAALVKAMLVNGAVDLSGQYVPTEAAATPNNAEGFGRVNLQRALAREDGTELVLHDEGRELSTGDEEHFSLTIPAGGRDLRVTLVWTDYPGPSLVNDLDLIVRVGTEERHGNAAPGSSGFDRINNVEQVAWPRLPGDASVEVVVRAYRAALHPQSFALVVRTE